MTHSPDVISHGHEGHTHHAADRKALTRALALTCAYVGVELAGGWWSGSLALISDAGHMLTDAGALALALFAATLAARPATPSRSFGWHRVEILAALANGTALGALTLWIIWEAIARLLTPTPVEGGVMALIAAGGLVVNWLAAAALHAGHDHNLNVQGARWHVYGDMLGSAAALLAGLAAWGPGWLWADPAASLLISAVILWGATRLVLEAVDVLLENAPRGLDVLALQRRMEATPGVLAVHDLHVWSLTPEHRALSAHVLIDNLRLDEAACLRERLEAALVAAYGIRHTTLQLEHIVCEPNGSCQLRPV